MSDPEILNLGQLPEPTTDVIKEVVEEIKVPAREIRYGDPWKGHFSLGSLAEALIERGYTPLGVRVYISEYSASLRNDLKEGEYKIAGLPFIQHLSDRNLRLIPIVSPQVPGKVVFVSSQSWTFLLPPSQA